SLLINRFETTERCAKEELDLPLNAIFAHSEPRRKSMTPPNRPGENRRNSKSEHAGFEPAAFDKDSSVVLDNEHNEVVIPKDSAIDQNSAKKSRISNTASFIKSSRTRGDKIRVEDKSIITEADNPQR
ncbi:hypothetical protein ACTXGO_12765, partial [Psychrobacter sp. T6-1]